MIGQEWTNLPAAEKLAYKEKQKWDRDRYLNELSEIPIKSQPILLSSCVSGSGHFKQLKHKIQTLNLMPTKKLSPYVFFVKERHEQMKKDTDYRFDLAMKKLSVEWREMSDKSRYIQMAEQDKVRYGDDMTRINELK